MNQKKALGNKYEERAVTILRNLGCLILERNYRFKRNEVDIIVKSKEGILIFIEVKYRASRKFGSAEGFANDKQLSRIEKVAEEYVYKINWFGRIQFDIIAFTGTEVYHFKDVFS